MKRLIAPAAGMVLLGLLLVPGTVQAKSKYADVRVVTSGGDTLAEHRQYTDDVTVKASRKADCFGESNPSSGQKYELTKPTVLGALIDAADNYPSLDPLRITDAFFGDFGSFGVCGIGGIEGEGFSYWYSAVNGEAAQAGPNQIPVGNGDRNLWYLTTGSESSISELELRAPSRVAPGETFGVKVVRLVPDGSKEPAEGVSVIGGTGGTTGPDGRTEISLPAGTTNLVTEGEDDDVPSGTTLVCAQEQRSDCPKTFGIAIRGTDGPDRIRGTRGADDISCGRGKDVVRKAQKSDTIARNCEKVRRG